MQVLIDYFEKSIFVRFARSVKNVVGAVLDLVQTIVVSDVFADSTPNAVLDVWCDETATTSKDKMVVIEPQIWENCMRLNMGGSKLDEVVCGVSNSAKIDSSVQVATIVHHV